MSFSKRFRGFPSAILAELIAFAAEQRALDERCGASVGVIEGHTVQIAAATVELTPILNNAPTSVNHELNLAGSSSDDGFGESSWMFNRNEPLLTKATLIPDAPAAVSDDSTHDA